MILGIPHYFQIQSCRDKMTLSFFRNEKFFPDVLGHFIILSNYLFVEIKSRVRSERIGLSFFRCFKKRSRLAEKLTQHWKRDRQIHSKNQKTRRPFPCPRFMKKCVLFEPQTHSEELGQDGVRMTKSGYQKRMSTFASLDFQIRIFMASFKNVFAPVRTARGATFES